MKKSSLGKFHYALRPAKNMERKMLCEAFARLSRIASPTSYRYIGFGSIDFCDFTLFHERLGIKHMVSIERLADSQERVEFNLPYSCIKMEWGESHEVLPTLEWGKRTIIWLDYDGNLDTNKLGDIALVAGEVKSGSVLLVTVPVNPGDTDDINLDKRLDGLRKRVGTEKVPPSVEAKCLSKWGMAEACREIVHNEILQTLSNRNAPVRTDFRISYYQLFNFHYADGIRMLTVGGIFLNEKDKAKLSVENFKDLDFIKRGKESHLIEVPILTWREMRYLDKGLPGSAPKVPEPKWLPAEDRKKYGKVYRYFPNFSEVEA